MRRTGVAATMVACSLLVGCSTKPSGQPAGAISPTPADSVVEPSPSVVDPSPSVVEPVETTLADLPQGTPPKIGYVERNTYVAPDGARTRLRLPHRGGVGAFARHQGGFVVAGEIYFEGTVGLVVIDACGGRIEIECSGGAPVPSRYEDLAAWTTIPCPELGVAQPPAAIQLGERVQSLPGDHLTVVGVIGDRVMFTYGFTDGVWVTNLVDEPTRVAGLGDVQSVSRSGLIAGRRTTDDEETHAVVRMRSGKALWTTPRELGAFSPDGRRILGVRRGQDGGIIEVAVLTARSGKLESSFTLPDGLEGARVEWEDNKHLLVVARGGRSWAILRADFGGSFTRTTPTLTARRHQFPPFVLAERP